MGQQEHLTLDLIAAREAASTGSPLRRQYLRGFVELLIAPNRFYWILWDLLTLPAAFLFGWWVSPAETWLRVTDNALFGSAVYTVCFVFICLGLGYYDKVRRFERSFIFRAIAAATFISLLFTFAGVYLWFYKQLGRYNLIYGGLIASGFALAVRLFLAQFVKLHPFKFIAVGRSDLIDSVLESFRENGSSLYHFGGEVSARKQEDDAAYSVNLDGVGALVMSQEALMRQDMAELASQALKRGCRVIDDITFYSEILEKLPINSQTRTWILRESVQTHHLIADLSKRLFDFVGALAGVILLSPLLALLALLIKLSDGGPIFFTQERAGQYGQSFRIIKFRSMKAGDHGTLGATTLRDHRVTWIGRIMRPAHLDELPQLWNILRGEMSIVGPRPEFVHFIKKISSDVPLFGLRNLCKPGLTGWAQINQGYTLDSAEEMTEKLSFDLYYVWKRSFGLDFRIIIRTVFTFAKRSR